MLPVGKPGIPTLGFWLWLMLGVLLSVRDLVRVFFVNLCALETALPRRTPFGVEGRRTQSCKSYQSLSSVHHSFVILVFNFVDFSRLTPHPNAARARNSEHFVRVAVSYHGPFFGSFEQPAYVGLKKQCTTRRSAFADVSEVTPFHRFVISSFCR